MTKVIESNLEKVDKELIALMKPSMDNTYDCKHCKDAGIKHKVISQFDGHTDKYSCWGEGIPTTIRICTTCKRWDGGWVSSDIVGGGW